MISRDQAAGCYYKCPNRESKDFFLSLNKLAPEAVYLNEGDTVTERDINVAIDVYLLRVATEKLKNSRSQTMKSKFFVGVVIFFLVTFFAFFFRLFRPFVGVVVSPVNQTVVASVKRTAVAGVAESNKSVDVRVEKNI